MKKIVTIGGGTGSYQVLRGLKEYTSNITAIVSMFDSGGSSGRLRDEYGVLPPGDARRCLIALEKEPSVVRQIFEYRFQEGELKGHNLGNLILTGLTKIRGSDAEAIKQATKLLNVKGTVLPVTIDNCHLCARLENKQIVEGETNIDVPKHDPNLKIEEIFLKPEAYLYEECIEPIMQADSIIIGPGDLYTSVLPNILVKNMPEVLKRSSAKKIYMCNLMTKHGETDGYKASHFVRGVEKYLGKNVLNHVVVNTQRASENLLKHYAETEHAHLVEIDAELRKLGYEVREEDIITEEGNLIRHDPKKTARVIMSL